MKPLNYIKVPAKVAEEWGVTREYPRLPDGNYALYWGVPNARGYAWTDYPQMFRDTGAKILTPAQVRLEQEGLQCTALDEPEDPRYREDATTPGTPGQTETEITEEHTESETGQDATETETESVPGAADTESEPEAVQEGGEA